MGGDYGGVAVEEFVLIKTSHLETSVTFQVLIRAHDAVELRVFIARSTLANLAKYNLGTRINTKSS